MFKSLVAGSHHHTAIKRLLDDSEKLPTDWSDIFDDLCVPHSQVYRLWLQFCGHCPFAAIHYAFADCQNWLIRDNDLVDFIAAVGPRHWTFTFAGPPQNVNQLMIIWLLHKRWRGRVTFKVDIPQRNVIVKIDGQIVCGCSLSIADAQLLGLIGGIDIPASVYETPRPFTVTNFWIYRRAIQRRH